MSGAAGYVMLVSGGFRETNNLRDADNFEENNRIVATAANSTRSISSRLQCSLQIEFLLQMQWPCAIQRYIINSHCSLTHSVAEYLFTLALVPEI